MFGSVKDALNGMNESGGATGDCAAGVAAYLDGLRRDPVLRRLDEHFAPLTVAGRLGPADALSSVVHAERLVLAGEAGSGKTTLLKVAARRGACAPGKDRPSRVPVYVDLAEADAGKGVDELIARAVAAAGGGDLPLAAIDPALLLIDHLDRVADVYLLEGLELLMRAGGMAGPGVAVACRQADWPAFSSWFEDVPVVTLQPLSGGAVTDALRRSLPAPAAQEAEGWMARDRHLAAAVRRPIALAAFVQAIRDRAPSTWQRSQVLDALLEAFLADVPAMERTAYRTALADVAVRSLGAGLPVEVDTRAMALGVSRDDMIKTGAVVADGPRLAFVEPLLAHHCAASSLAGRLAANPRQLAEGLGDLRDPRTADTLVHVYIMSPSPAAFAAALMPLDGGPEVAARCIAEPHAADPAGAAGPEAVVRELVALTPPAPVASLFRLGEALARHGQEGAAEVALRSALDRTDGEVDLDEIFERPDVDAPPPVSEWLREFVKKRNRGLAMRGLKDEEAEGALHQAARALGRIDTDLTFERGLAAAAAGDLDRAIAAFQAAVAAEPDRVRYQYHLGRTLVGAGRVDEAVAHLTKAQDQAPSNPMVAAALADALKARDELDAARRAIRTARELDPAQPAFEQAEGELSAELGDLEAAAARMGAAVAARPDRPSWHDALGQVQAERGNWAAAVEAFRAAHDLAPEEPLFLRHMGRALLEVADAPGAVAALRHASRLATRDAGIASDLARALATVGETGQALEVLEKALAADDLWPADHLLMARLLRQTGHLRRSLTHARRAVELAPASDRAASELKRIEGMIAAQEAGQPLAPPPEGAAPVGPAALPAEARRAPTDGDIAPAGGLEALAAAARDNPDSAAAHRRWAHGLRAAGQEEKALGVLRRAARIDPHDATLLAELGWTALALGRVNEARYAAGAAIEMAPDNPELHALKADADMAAGDTEAARAEYARAAELAPDHPGYARRAQDLTPARHEVHPPTAPTGPTAEPTAAASPPSWLAAADASRGVPQDPPAPAAPRAAPREAPAEVPAEAPGGSRPSAAAPAAPTDDERLEILAAEARGGGGPEACLEWSRLALDLRALDDAIEGARRAVAQAPESATAHEALAEAYAASGLPEAALTAVGRAATLSPSRPELRQRQADLATQMGRLDEAIACLEEGIADNPGSGLLQLALGKAFQARGWSAEARTAFRAAAALDPREPRAQRALAESEADVDPEAALAALDRLVADAADASAWLLRGRLHLRLGHDEAALADLQQAAQTNPDDPVTARELAQHLRRLGQPEAEAAYRRALELDASDAEALAGLGALLADEGRLDEAEEALGQAVSVAPDGADFWLALGQVRQAAGHREAAVEALSRAAELAPDTAVVQKSLGQALADLGHHADAAVAFAHAARLAPDDAEVLCHLGRSRMEDRDLAGAVAAFERAIAADGDNVAALTGLSEAAAMAGRFDSALRHAQRATDIAPADPSAWAALATAGRAAGDLETAAKALARASEAAPEDPEGYRILAEVAAEQGNSAATVGALCKLLAAAPGDPQAALQLGELLADGGYTVALVAPEDTPAVDADAAEVAMAALRRLLGGAAEPGAADRPSLARAARSLAVLQGRLGDAAAAVATATEATGLAETPANLLTLAWANLLAMEPAAALRALGQARARGADDAAVHMLTAQAHAARGDFTLAKEAFSLAAARDPDLADAVAGVAAMCAALGQQDAALAAYRRARDMDASGRWDRELGSLALEAGEAAEAAAVLDGYVRSHPGDPEARRELALALAALGDGARAAAELTRAVTLAPNHPAWHADLADLHRAAGDMKAAQASLAQAKGLDPNDADVRLLEARLALAQGRTKDARKAIEVALKMAPTSPRGHALKGRIALEAGDDAAARDAFAEAVRLEPDSAGLHYWLGVTAKAAGDMETAQEHLETAARLDTRDATTFMALGEVYAAAGAADDAIQAYEQAAVCAPEDPGPHMRLGRLCASMDLGEKALAHYERAAELAPKDYRPCYAVAQHHLEAGRLDAAGRAFAAAVAREPDDADVYFEAGLTFKKLRHYGRAADMFRRTTRRSPAHAAAYTQLAAVSALHFLDRSAGEAAVDEAPGAASPVPGAAPALPREPGELEAVR